MKVKVTTYKTLKGKKRYLEPLKKSNYQWIIYSGKRPTYFVDIFDLKTESNVLLNSLIFSSKMQMEQIITILNKKFKLTLSLPKPPYLSTKVKSEIKEFNLVPMPEEWLGYSL